MGSRKKIFFIINVDYFLLSHRKEIALAAKNNDFDVTIVAKNTGKKQEISNLGFNFIELPMERSNTNYIKEIRTLLFLYFLFKKEKPDIIHHVGLKIVLIGTIAAKLARIHGIVNAISGLGFTFSSENIKSFSTNMIIRFLKYSHKRENLVCIFQNHEDKEIFLNNKIIGEHQFAFIKGSGVDLNNFGFCPEPKAGKIKIAFAARMIKEKGILELIEAANILKANYYGKIQIVLCGAIDNNPTAIKEEELSKLCDNDYIIWLGHVSDIKQILVSCHIVAFPSYYREGLPKFLIEACAIGRPIVTTNSIGCKDVVIDSYNGYLVAIKDSQTLSEKIKILIDNKMKREEFGKNSRLIAEREFSIESVVAKHLNIYKQLSLK